MRADRGWNLSVMRGMKSLRSALQIILSSHTLHAPHTLVLSEASLNVRLCAATCQGWRWWRSLLGHI